MTTLHGLWIPLVTPFDADGGVAHGALERLAHDSLDAGATGLVALGSTGEPGALTEAEKHAVVATVARVCRERSAPLIVGAATAEALAALGEVPEATAALTVVPPFVRPGEAAVVAHFARLAAASPVPLVVYDIPYRTGQYLSVTALRQLAALPNVAGVKYAVGGLNEDTIALLAEPLPGFAVLGGDDAFISPLLALGARGGILASAHLATAQFAHLVTAWRDGYAVRARALGHRLAPLSQALFAEPNPTVIKAALHAQGRIPTPSVRPPLLEADPDSTAAALKQLAEIGSPS
ncbi:dihydrodipicolinate synthase family protein [Catellatospora bangladeshensis]|uniref:4-hydroxy-tetrahydrodipicolinate synthase n=1 Tax=Catellatospora bangladeshensis TaxID=310355 RepID=A0A8J3J9C0_9ACTN|nr:dihydrodipicolinate synthase family protein [Catellatospora bangladeshensis]GIF80717.1 4-hydroxy-tetrahydrodipicolinate synthase [Catellatospora bangladeshensis]